MGKPLPCRLGWHKWVVRFNADHERFRQCARCGKDHSGVYVDETFTGPGGGL